MSSYSPEMREKIVRKMMPPGCQSAASIHRETGISMPTLYAWKRQFREKGFVVPSKSTKADDWDGKAKLAAIVQTAAMNQAERSAYCREHGLHVEQLEGWKQSMEAAEGKEAVTPGELARARAQIRQLQKELARKEKALAETAALLALSKKARAIWGMDAED